MADRSITAPSGERSTASAAAARASRISWAALVPASWNRRCSRRSGTPRLRATIAGDSRGSQAYAAMWCRARSTRDGAAVGSAEDPAASSSTDPTSSCSSFSAKYADSDGHGVGWSRMPSTNCYIGPARTVGP